MEAGLKWLAAGVLSMWLGLSDAVRWLLIFMLLDYATGLIAAAMRQQLSSSKGFHGLGKKALTLILIVAAHVLARAAALGVDLGGWVAIAYCGNEFISIIENCKNAGVPIPKRLMDALESAESLWDGPDRRMSSDVAYAGRERRKEAANVQAGPAGGSHA